MDVIKKKHWWQSDALKWSVLGLLGLLVGYLVVLMYAQGEYLFAITTLILSSAGLYIFAGFAVAERQLPLIARRVKTKVIGFACLPGAI